MELVITEQDSYTRLFRQAIEKWGEVAQMDMVTEEAAEVIQAINKWKRDPSEQAWDHLHEEFADLQICIDQMASTVLSHNDLQEWYRKKMKKFEGKLTQDKL